MDPPIERNDRTSIRIPWNIMSYWKYKVWIIYLPRTKHIPNPSNLSFKVIEGKHDSLEEIELGVLVSFSISVGLFEENLKNVAISISP